MFPSSSRLLHDCRSSPPPLASSWSSAAKGSFHACYEAAAPGAEQSVDVWERGCGFLMWKFRLDWIFSRISYPEAWDSNTQVKNVDESGKICFHTFTQCFEPIGFKEPRRYSGTASRGLKENKETFHFSLNMSTYIVAQAHKQCETGTTA